MQNQFEQNAGSFRDPCGVVYQQGNLIFRTINNCYKEHWDYCISSRFFETAIKKQLLLPFDEVNPINNTCYKTIQSQFLPIISYPSEWSFSQYKDAALLTLDLLDEALSHDIVLKDATAYNIQFIGSKPIFIDHLSFEKRDPHKPWKAYLQFCKHFLAPLAIMAKCSLSCNRMMSCYIDGIPLDVASSLLPWKTKFSLSLGIHIHAHAKMQAKYGDAREAATKIKSIKIDEDGLKKLSQSLRYAIESLELPHHLSTEWGDYYTDTNYTSKGANHKMQLLETIAKNNQYKDLAIDIGANQGVYSKFLAKEYKNVMAIDIDYLAIEKLYLQLKKENNTSITPLVFDLGNPTPAIGWANKERMNLTERIKASYLSALALVHHLYFTAGIPLDKMAEYFSGLLVTGGILAFEFVPLEDSQVKRLLAAKEDTYPDYNLENCLQCFGNYFEIMEKHAIEESVRTLIVLKKK